MSTMQGSLSGIFLPTQKDERKVLASYIFEPQSPFNRSGVAALAGEKGGSASLKYMEVLINK